jgi:6-phosphogluconolactonase
LVILSDLESASREAARRWLAALANPRRGPFRAALAGGRTPRRLYELLAGEEFAPQIPWRDLHVFLTDERLVPHDHVDSNYRMLHDSLLRRAPLPPENIHAVRPQLSSDEAAAAYEGDIREHFRQPRGVPTFDFVLLGLGADGHVASLFPAAPALEEKERLVVAHRPAAAGQARVTLTLPVLNAARRVVFLVAGKDKAAALREGLKDGLLPVQRVAPPSGELVWLVDAEAAGRLDKLRVETAPAATP